MGFEYLTNVPLEQARREYLELLEHQGFEPQTQVIPVYESCGRVTAEAVYAHICAPHYTASAMDGVAVCARDTFGATETTPVTLHPEQFTVLDTGDPVPEGRDAVIMVEDQLIKMRMAPLPSMPLLHRGSISARSGRMCAPEK